MSFLEKLKDIESFIFDIDGVFTDGSVIVQDDGSLLRMMNTKDGLAIKQAVNQGFQVFVITGGKSPGLILRLQNLGIGSENIFPDIHDKITVLKKLARDNRLDLSKSAYMGDDLPDYGPMRLVHLPCCPSDAVIEIKEIAQYISPFAGGKGCVRDLLEKVLKIQGKWFDLESLML